MKDQKVNTSAAIKHTHLKIRENANGHNEVLAGLAIMFEIQGKQEGLIVEYNLSTKEGFQALSKQLEKIGVGPLRHDQILEQLLYVEERTFKAQFWKDGTGASCIGIMGPLEYSEPITLFKAQDEEYSEPKPES